VGGPEVLSGCWARRSASEGAFGPGALEGDSSVACAVPCTVCVSGSIAPGKSSAGTSTSSSSNRSKQRKVTGKYTQITQ